MLFYFALIISYCLIKIFNCIYHFLLYLKLHLSFCDVLLLIDFMMPGSKGLNPHELAHKGVKDLGIHTDMSIKAR